MHAWRGTHKYVLHICVRDDVAGKISILELLLLMKVFPFLLIKLMQLYWSLCMKNEIMAPLHVAMHTNRAWPERIDLTVNSPAHPKLCTYIRIHISVDRI